MHQRKRNQSIFHTDPASGVIQMKSDKPQSFSRFEGPESISKMIRRALIGVVGFTSAVSVCTAAGNSELARAWLRDDPDIDHTSFHFSQAAYEPRDPELAVDAVVLVTRHGARTPIGRSPGQTKEQFAELWGQCTKHDGTDKRPCRTGDLTVLGEMQLAREGSKFYQQYGLRDYFLQNLSPSQVLLRSTDIPRTRLSLLRFAESALPFWTRESILEKIVTFPLDKENLFPSLHNCNRIRELFAATISSASFRHMETRSPYAEIREFLAPLYGTQDFHFKTPKPGHSGHTCQHRKSEQPPQPSDDIASSVAMSDAPLHEHRSEFQVQKQQQSQASFDHSDDPHQASWVTIYDEFRTRAAQGLPIRLPIGVESQLSMSVPQLMDHLEHVASHSFSSLLWGQHVPTRDQLCCTIDPTPALLQNQSALTIAARAIERRRPGFSHYSEHDFSYVRKTDDHELLRSVRALHHRFLSSDIFWGADRSIQQIVHVTYPHRDLCIASR